MLILLLFAFISGLVTIAAPCVWPLLPIVLSATATGGRRKPLGITLGVMISFAFFTLSLSYILKIIPFDPNSLRAFAVLVLVILGLTLLIPQLSAILEGWVSRLSSRFGVQNKGSGFLSGAVTGFFLGLIWSPCAGPILATIATLAATQQVNFKIILVTLFYVLGIGIPLFIFASLGQVVFSKVKFVSKYTGIIQQIFGLILIISAIAIYFNFNPFPASNFLTSLETQPQIQNQLKTLTGKPTQTNYGPAPEFIGITKWLNSDPLTMTQLKGRVVLIDFWTYTCINCIRTLPYVTSWYDKYKDKGFVVIGVHTPEFEFEKKTENVLAAIKQYNIKYPVAQDNEYLVWNAYSNQYWPAEYLIDAKGNIRHTHFGEGEYKQTEKAIQDLLKEAGVDAQMPLTTLQDSAPKSQITPETYLGLTRRERFEKSPNNLPLDHWSISGDWDINPEYITSKSNSFLDFNFQAAKVFLVITPATSSDTIKVSLDGKEINTINVTQSKLYTLVDLPQKGTHLLHLDFQTPGTKAYAFTFGD